MNLSNCLLAECQTWFWHDNPCDQVEHCDFENNKRLKSAFDALDLSAKPYSNTVCHSFGRFDERALEDPNRPIQIHSQGYIVKGKECIVSSGRAADLKAI